MTTSLPPSAPPTTPQWGLPAALGVFSAWVFGALIGSAIAVGLGATAGSSAVSVAAFLGQGAAALAALGVVTLVRGQRSFARDFGFRAYVVDLMWLPAGAGLQILGSIVLIPALRLAGSDGAPQDVARTFANTSGATKILLVLCLGVLAPVIEELMFRGILMRSVQRFCSAPVAVLITAAAFSVMHLLDPNAWLVLPTLFAFGILAGFLANRTGRLGPSIALHAGFNLVALITILLTSHA